MQFTTAAILGLAAQCAPNVAPSTIAAVVHTESKGFQFAINVNGAPRQPPRPRDAASAARVAQSYIARGHSVDLGLGQINSNNMSKLGLSWETVFDPCTNIAAAGEVLSGNYQQVRRGRMPQAALRVALSMYNTGSKSRGFRNGYVSRVLNNAGVSDGIVPADYSPSPSPTGEAPATHPAAAMLADLVTENMPATSPAQRDSAPPPPPAWDVFSRAAYDRARSAEAGGS